MSRKSPIELAKAYVEASNAHNLNTIETMLSVECRYHSSGVGDHVGRDAILEMMRGFFDQNPDVHWDTRNWVKEGQDTVAFDFTISLPTGTSSGREWIQVDQEGLISRIRVAR